MSQQNDEKKARDLLKKGEVSCVLVKGDQVITKNMRGIGPLAQLWEQKPAGFYGADLIVGRAAALLMAGMGLSGVYGEVMSRGAAEVLARFSIPYSYGVLTESIRNRKGDGECPMEQAVRGIEDPAAAYEAVKETLRRLRSSEGSGS